MSSGSFSSGPEPLLPSSGTTPKEHLAKSAPHQDVQTLYAAHAELIFRFFRLSFVKLMAANATKGQQQHERDVQAIIAHARKGDPWSVVPAAVDAMLRDALQIGDDVRAQIVEAVRAGQLPNAIAEALGGRPTLVSAKDLIDEARLVSEAREVVLRHQRMLSADDAGRFLGSTSTTKPSQYAHDARKRGELLGLPVRNTFVFPVFQLDRRRKAVRPAAARINKLLGAAVDPWGVASWWVGPSERGGGKTPVELLEANELETLEHLAELEAAPLDP